MFFTSEQKQLEETLEGFLKDTLSSEYLRKCIESPGGLPDNVLWKTLLDLGLFEYFGSSQQDEKGSLIDLGIIANLSGKYLLPLPLADYLYAGPYLFSRLAIGDQKELEQGIGGKFLSEVMTGKAGVAFCGFLDSPAEIRKQKKGLEVSGVFPHVVCGHSSAHLLLIGSEKDGRSVYLSKESVSVAETSEDCLDRTLPLRTFRITKGGLIRLASLDAAEVAAEYHCLVASQLAGSAAKAMQLSLEHCSSRKQFDRPIGAFQAVQHQLADMHLRVEASKALSDFACFAAEKSRSQLRLAGEAAIRYCRQAAPEVLEKAIQVHGGIGFTWEYDLHLYLRRVMALSALTSYLQNPEPSRDFVDLLTLK